MKIGIMTFHWARNCGAVIQCFAMQKFLRKNGFDVVVLDYTPQVWWRRWKNYLAGSREYRRNCRTFAAFRRNYLSLSREALCRNSLSRISSRCDAVISGSDQVWNLNYAQKADGTIDFSYFLDFITGGIPKKIAYATSAGNGLESPKWQSVENFLHQFAAISVREPGLAKVLANLGVVADVVADPALLLEKNDYIEIVAATVGKSAYFGYLLKENVAASSLFRQWSTTTDACQVMACELAADRRFDWGKSAFIYPSPVDFLSGISGAEKVLTDSFHGTVFSLLFNRPFVTLVKSTDNAGGNERLVNLLERCGLSDRLVATSDATIDHIDQLFNTPIDWERVNASISTLRRTSGDWLLDKLK